MLLVACSGDGSPEAPPFDISGAWLFAEAFSDAALGLSCTSATSIDIDQAGARFTGEGILRGFCTGPGGSDSVGGVPLAVTKGEIDGTSVQFEVDGCPYDGIVFGQEADSLTGTMTCRFEDGGTQFNLRGEWRFVREDHQPPTVSGSTFGGASGANASFETGDDTLYVRIHAEDDRALRTMGYQITKPSPYTIVRRDSVLITGTVAEDTLIFPLPLGLDLPRPEGTPFSIEVFARDSSGNEADRTQLDPVLVVPAAPPSVSGAIAGTTNDSVGALRDTIEITVTATAPRPLKYFGYRITTFTDVGDSVTSTEKADSHVFRIPVPFEWKGLLVQFEVFARDQFDLENWGPLGGVRVAVFPSRPTQMFPDMQMISDLVLDPARNRVYFPSANSSGEPQLSVFDLTMPGYAAQVPLPWFSEGVDLSPGGNSVIITTYSGRLGLIDLNTLVVDSTAPLAFTPANGRYPFRVRAMANDKALVSIRSASWGDGSPGQLLDYDLATGVQILRTDVGSSGDVGRTPLLARSSDRQHLFLFTSDVDEPTQGQAYHVGTDQFDPVVSIAGPGYVVSGDQTGSRWLVGNQLLAGDLSASYILGSDTTEAVASALSDDGTIAYVAVPEGVAKFATSDGVELERILLPDPPIRMLVTPDGTTLIAIAPQGLLLVDLR